MTVFFSVTPKNSISEQTATAAVAIEKTRTEKKVSRQFNTIKKSLEIGEENFLGSLCETATTTTAAAATNDNNRKEKMEDEQQIGLVSTKTSFSVINSVACGETPHRHRTYSSNGHHTRALGMILFFVFVISSTSSVLCVPLEHPELTGSSVLTQQQQQEEESLQPNYILESLKGLYLPSILNPTQDENQRNYQEYFNPRLQIQENEDESIPSESGGWETVIDPHLYVLTEWDSNPILQQQRTRRNAGPSLSIVNPLDVLRQRLLLEIARRRMRQSHQQIMQNAKILKDIGKRK